MKVLTVIFLLVTLACLVQAKRYPYKALKFLDAVRADILFKANLQPIQEEFTICSWVRKLRDSDDTRADGDLIPIWFNYATPDDKMEILISDDGYYNNFFSVIDAHTGLTVGKEHGITIACPIGDIMKMVMRP